MPTFIVRLVREANGGPQAGPGGPRLRGVVDEVATGTRTTFRDGQELVAALTAALAALAARPDEQPINREGQHVAD